LPELDALVVADYQDLGVLTPRIRSRLNELARSHPEVKFLADSRWSNASQGFIDGFDAMTLKPNELEAAQLFYPGRDPATVSLDDLIKPGQEWSSRSRHPVFITLGARGSLLIDGLDAFCIPAIQIPGLVDPVGAGDTFLACLAACQGTGFSPLEAAQVATLATAVTVHKIHVTGTATPGEILAIYDSASPGLQFTEGA